MESLAAIPLASDFRCFIELEGPDFRLDGGQRRTKHEALIQDGGMLAWLEAKGFRLGVGLIIGDSEALLTSFVSSFLDSVITAMRTGSEHLLRHLIKKDGLDLQTLWAWQTATSLLNLSFIALLLPDNANASMPAEIVIKGLNALAADVRQAVRRPLRLEIGTRVQKTAEELKERFGSCFASDSPWLTSAVQLWELRNIIASSEWVHSALEPALVQVSRS